MSMTKTKTEDAVASSADQPDEPDQTTVEPAAAATDASAAGTAPHNAAGRRVSVSLRGFFVGLVIALLVAAVGVLSWLYIDASGQLRAQDRTAADIAHAEDVAMSYAVSAAEMDYQDFEAWKIRLVEGTSPELKEKLGSAANSMQEILAPLQWKSTARPLAAKVRSHTGGIFVVDSFVSVLTKTMQAPDGLQSTATYSVTLDSNNNWQITDVGGIDAALGK